jgi:hypothetical protein
VATDFWSSLFSLRGGGKVKLVIFLHNLVHSLTRQIKLICYRTKTRARFVKFKNPKISIKIGGRARAKWAPLPISNGAECLYFGGGKFPVPVSLPHVTNPRAKRDWSSLNVLGVHRRDSAVALPSDVLVECCNCQIESGDVVHKANINIRVSAKLVSTCSYSKISFFKCFRQLTVVESK